MKKFVIEFGAKEIGVALACALTFGGGFAVVQSYTGEAQENGLPMVLPYQGTLSKAGAPFTGTQAMQFKLYSDASGAAFWTSDPRSVDVVGGKFAVTLGDVNDTDKLEAQDFRHSELYVELVVDGTTLSPKQRVAPAPQALVAASAREASPTGSLRSELDTLSPKLTDSSVGFEWCGGSGFTCPRTISAYTTPTNVDYRDFNVSVNSRWLVRVQYTNVDSWNSGWADQYIAAVVDTTTVARIQRYTALGLESSGEAIGIVDLAPGTHRLNLRVYTPGTGPTMHAPFRVDAWQIGVTD